MYDNLDFTVTKDQSPGTDFLQIVPQFLTTISNKGVNQFGEYVTGYLDSLKVSISESRVKISDCSLCKYYLGDNFKTLTKGDTKRAIQKISDCLHLPFDRANITRIDFAKNLIMQYDEKVYYPYLGEAQYYTRLPQNNGLYYNNQLRQLVFYGKEYEQKLKRQPVPELYKDRNVLRFEMRFRKQLRQQLKQPEITAGLLTDETFYSGLVTRWKDEYFAIQKINSKLISMKPTGSTKELIENMALFQLLELGQPQLLTIVKEWQIRGLITKKQANDHRAKIKQLSKTPFDEKGNDLINELNRKVKEAARNW
ncbi:MAG: hypothetical protein NTY07_02250 [Bacteroidia bacterium]|nr:hypothetical protein [Bacteroidia bacterium]